MTLIKSISGIRGTIGGTIGKNFTPIDIVECTAAFGQWALKKTNRKKIIVGRDARISGEMVNNLVCNTLIGLGFEVIDLGLSTTPTVEIAVPKEKAAAGIVLTASHNPKQWNALKFLNHKGEFISAQDGKDVLQLIENKQINFVPVLELGKIIKNNNYLDIHINDVLKLPHVNSELIKTKQFIIVVDAINSSGAISVAPLLKKLNCKVILINGEPNGHFAHNPEPLPANLQELSQAILDNKADLGIAIDPDVDRLAFVNQDGSVFGEEYTLVAIADYVLSKEKGNTVSNLSSTRALRDVTLKHGGSYSAAAVGEVNVVSKMKETNAIIGGEGNGGVIYPSAHYGRDALVGIALFLSHLSEQNISMTKLKETYPSYFISKNKIELTPQLDIEKILAAVANKYKNEELNTIDGVKIDFKDGWVHLRKSNTEPIIRVYSEATNEKKAIQLAEMIKSDIQQFL